jgi:hypothetical protein
MSTHGKTAVAIALMLAVTGVAQAATGSGAIGRTNPHMFSTPRATAGVAPGINPANTQDMTNRGNRQDMTLPSASNPQNLRR